MKSQPNTFLSKILKQIFLGTVRTKQSKEYFECGFYENINLTTRDDVKIGAALFKPDNVNDDTKFVIFFHGSGTNRDDISNARHIKYLVSENIMLLVPDYRDFGDSEGTFTRESVNLDVLASFDYLINSYDAKLINVIGFSFGTAIVAEYIKFINKSKDLRSNKLSAHNNITFEKNKYYITDYKDVYVPNKLILLAPYSSFPKLMSEFRLVKILKLFIPKVWNIISNDFKYDTINNLEYYNPSKLYILHGTHDPLIKINHSLEIRNKFKCFFKEIKTDHIRILVNDEVWNYIDEILKNKS